MNSSDIIKMLVSYFIAEIENTISVKVDELTVELADKTKVKISVKV